MTYLKKSVFRILLKMKKLHAICTQFFLFLSVYLYICSVNDSFLLAPWGAVTVLLENSLSPSGAGLRN